MTVKTKIVPTEAEIAEGAATWLLEAFGYEFAIHFVAGKLNVYGTQSLAYDRRPRWQVNGAKKKCEEQVWKDIESFGPEFMARHIALYEMDK